MLFIILFASVITAGAKTATRPHIESGRGTCSVVMPKTMWAALKKHAPDFAIYRFEKYEPSLFRPSSGWHYEVTDQQAPFAVVGDFNGDQAKDVIVKGCTRTSCGLVAILSRGKGFVASDVQPGAPQAPGYPRPDDYPMEDVLRLVRPGVIRSPHLEPEPLVLKNDAVEEIYVGKASSIYYYTGDRYFATYVTSD